MKTIAIMLCWAVVLGACNKDKDTGLDGYTIVTGKLLDAATLEPIPGGKVTVHEDWVKIDTTSGIDGSYYFRFKHKEGYRYALTAEADHYLGNNGIGIWAADYPNGKASPELLIETNIENVLNTKLPPEGFVKYHFKQTKPFNGNIEVRFSPYTSLSVISYNGQGLDVVYMDRTSGGTYHRIGCSIIRNGDSLQTFSDTLLIPRFDTLNYTIEF